MLALVIVAALGVSPETLEASLLALADLEYERAVELSQEGLKQTPHKLDDHIALYRTLGIAHAAAGNRDAAVVAFDWLLALDPSHAIDYTFPAQVTFPFQRVRQQEKREVPALEVDWPRALDGTLNVPITVEVLADPKAMLTAATLYYRRGTGELSMLRESLKLGAAKELVIAAPVVALSHAETLSFHLVVQDEIGNEVYRVGTEASPREVSLTYIEPVPWYRKWWVWASIGIGFAAAVGATTSALLYEPPKLVGGQGSVSFR